jgi:hypothetical protein
MVGIGTFSKLIRNNVSFCKGNVGEIRRVSVYILIFGTFIFHKPDFLVATLLLGQVLKSMLKEGLIEKLRIKAMAEQTSRH